MRLPVCVVLVLIMVAGAHRNWVRMGAEQKREPQSIVLTTVTATTPVRIDLVFERIGDTSWRLQNLNVYAYTPHPGLLGGDANAPARLVAVALALASVGFIVFTLVSSARSRPARTGDLRPRLPAVQYPAGS